MTPAPLPDPAAVAAVLEVAEDEGAPRAWLRLYGRDRVTRALQKLKQGGWELRQAPIDPPGGASAPVGQHRPCRACEGEYCECCGRHDCPEAAKWAEAHPE